MKDPRQPGRRQAAFFDLERNPERDAMTRPVSVLRSTEWGGLTLLSLLAGMAFPPYFFSVMALACLNAGGMLWVSHLNEVGRRRLKEFEGEFSVGHALEEEGDFRGAVTHYLALAPRYGDQPQMVQIAVHRAAHLKKEHPEAFSGHARLKTGAESRKAMKQQPAAPESSLDGEDAKVLALRAPKGVLRRKPA